MSTSVGLALAALVALSAIAANAQRSHEKMYVPLSGASCFRRLNGTHETGCTSDFGGSSGVLHVVRSAADLSFIHNSPPAPPYTIVLPTTLFTREHVLPLQRIGTGIIAGILLHQPLNQTARPSNYSSELQCPNQYSTYNQASCDAGHQPAEVSTLWNPAGNGLLHVSFPFPIYLLRNASEVQSVHDCFDRWNAADLGGQRGRSLCSVQINQFMAAAGNSEVCLRRSLYEKNVKPTQYCGTLRGHNLFATLFARDEVKKERRRRRTTTTTTTTGWDNSSSTGVPVSQQLEQFILVSAHLDSTSMFDGITPAAMESLPLVALLSTAHTLARLLPNRLTAAQPNILFVLFNGEAYDYIGSQRFVYDLRSGSFPPAGQRKAAIRPEQILMVVDVAGLDDPSAVTAYQVRDFPLATQLNSALEKYNRAFSLGVVVSPLVQVDQPPSAVQSFLRENASSWSTVALRSAGRPNAYLHSLYDDVQNVRYEYANTGRDADALQPIELRDEAFGAASVQMAVRNVSTVLALALYELVTGRTAEATLGGASVVLVDELLHCYLEATLCRLYRAAVPPAMAPPDGVVDRPPNRYISVGADYPQEVTTITYEMLAWLVGQRVNRTEAECERLPWHWVAGLNGTGECREGRHGLSEALSPAWLEEGYDLASGQYSTWTESTWSELNARLFLRPSPQQESFTLAIGFVVMVLSFVLAFLVSSRSDVLFGGRSAEPSIQSEVEATGRREGVTNAAAESASVEC